VLVRALTWNLFHGRDHPPDPSLFTKRSRFLRVTERGERYAQVNRLLRHEFTEVLARSEWEVALLQEAPPLWLRPLAADLGADSARALTSRNSLAPLRALAARLNPDLIASNEGGSNQLLVRAPWSIEEVRDQVVAREPERRVMLWARLREAGGRTLVVANVHGSVPSVPQAREQILAAAEAAVDWAGADPLLFGGDLNQRTRKHAETFAQLERRFGLAPPTPGNALDHLLVRGLEVVDGPRELPPESRELPTPDGLLLQLSDHPCVVATASMK
jgi:endonuclease/exonuclease/phosphatase family metal-dependent hydrolase